MTLIYEPAGRAREYAALACNVYRGCDHHCSYCYAPSATQRSVADFGQAAPRAGFMIALTKELAKNPGHGEQVLLCFTCDPFGHLDEKLAHTRQTIKALHAHGYHVCTLTKGGSRALRDRSLFTPQDAFATTLTLLNDGQSRIWEPDAALPNDRIETIWKFHNAGIPTWVSLEPVLDPAASLEIIRRTHANVDLFKVGKLNHHALSNRIDWQAFATQAIELLTSLGYRREFNPDAVQSANAANRLYYVKDDLAAFLPGELRRRPAAKVQPVARPAPPAQPSLL